PAARRSGPETSWHGRRQSLGIAGQIVAVRRRMPSGLDTGSIKSAKGRGPSGQLRFCPLHVVA
ncbi:MAG: hypothetical protein M3Y06_12325, partial [Actinomycetota bacterium]|nr:hypothetical protein [Actinomycetota bacterium]